MTVETANETTVRLDSATAARINNAATEALAQERNEARRELREFTNLARSEGGGIDQEKVLNDDKYKGRTWSDVDNEMMNRKAFIDAAGAELRTRADLAGLERAAQDELPEHVSFVPSGNRDRSAPVDPRNMLDVILNNAPEGMDVEHIVEAMNNNNGGSFENPNVTFEDILNAVVTTSTGISVAPPLRAPGVVMERDKRIGILPRLRTIQCPAASNEYKFLQETRTTSVIARTVEGAAAPEQTVTASDETISVVKLSVGMVVTEEQVADVPSFRDFANMRLAQDVVQESESQLITGTGSSGTKPGMTGLATISDSNSVSARQSNSSVTDIDQIVEGYDKLWSTANTEPSFVAMNYNLYKRLLLKKISSSDDRYQFGDVINGGADQLFGVPIVITQHLGNNDAYVMNVNDFAILRKGGVKTEMGLNSDDFSKGNRSLRISFRANLIPFRPGSLVKVDMTPVP